MIKITCTKIFNKTSSYCIWKIFAGSTITRVSVLWFWNLMGKPQLFKHLIYNLWFYESWNLFRSQKVKIFTLSLIQVKPFYYEKITRIFAFHMQNTLRSKNYIICMQSSLKIMFFTIVTIAFPCLSQVYSD